MIYTLTHEHISLQKNKFYANSVFDLSNKSMPMEKYNEININFSHARAHTFSLHSRLLLLLYSGDDLSCVTYFWCMRK